MQPATGSSIFSSPKQSSEGTALKGAESMGIHSLVASLHPSIVNKRTVIEVKDCYFKLRYDSGHDFYDSNEDSWKQQCGWQSLVYYAEHIVRKYHANRHMFYLTRADECPLDKAAKLIWRLDLSRISVRWEKIEIRISAVFNINDKVSLKLTSLASESSDEDRKLIKGLVFNKTNVILKSDLDSEQQMKYLDMELNLERGNPCLLDRQLDYKITDKMIPGGLFSKERPLLADDWGFSIKIFDKDFLDALTKSQSSKHTEDPANRSHPFKTCEQSLSTVRQED